MINEELCKQLDKELKERYPTKKEKIVPPVMQDNDQDWLDWIKRHKK
jgi:hypothetical protein